MGFSCLTLATIAFIWRCRHRHGGEIMTNLLFGWAAPFHRATELGDNSLCHNEQAVWHRFTANIKKLTWKDSWVTREVSVYTSDKYVPFRFLAVYESEEADLDAELVWTKKKKPITSCYMLATSLLLWMTNTTEENLHVLFKKTNAGTMTTHCLTNNTRLYVVSWCLHHKSSQALDSG